MEAKKHATMFAEQCVAGRIRLLNRAVTGVYDHALQSLGITINQATILVTIFLNRNIAAAGIGRKLLMEKSTVSRNLARLEANGWINTKKSLNSQQQTVSVTSKGRALLAIAHREWAMAQKETRQLLGDDGVEAIMEMYNRIQQRRN